MQKAMGHVLNIIQRGARACLQHMTCRAGALCTFLQGDTEQSFLKLAAALLQFYPSNIAHNLLVLGSANIYADQRTLFPGYTLFEMMLLLCMRSVENCPSRQCFS